MKNAQNGNKVRLKHLHVFKTRHGKTKIYFRKPGQKAVPIVSQFGTPEFHAEYTAALNNTPRPSIGIEKRNNADGTWNAAIALYIGSSAYASLARPEAYRATIAYLRQKVGDLPMRDFKPYMIKELIDGLVKDGKTSAANALSVVTRKVIEIAHEREWITIDLTKGLPKKQKQKNADGYRPWAEDEVLQWRAFYPDHRSMPRLALEALYSTGLRGRSDVTRVAWNDIKRRDGRLWLWEFIPEKTKRFNKKVSIPLIDPDLLDCLAHCPQRPGPLLRNASGEPFTRDYFGYVFKCWAKAAGLPSDFTPHGARKMIAVDAVEFGVNVDDGVHLTAHTPEQFRHYALKAKAEIGADRAIEQIVSGRSKRGMMRQEAA